MKLSKVQLIIKLIENADTMAEREWYIGLYRKYMTPADIAVLGMQRYYADKGSSR